MLDLRAMLGDAMYEGFMHHVALGRYNVLLGAGASADSLDQHGERMPVGTMLRDEIAHTFKLSDAHDKSLKRVYALASDARDDRGSTVEDFVKERFTQTKPADWLDDLLRIQWRSMWTLNVDDTIERAHTRLGAAARQKLKSVSWTDKHYQADRRLDELVLIHLHGKAHRANRTNELIFDISGYTTSLLDQHRWLKIFGDEYPAKPFVIIGASIDEEIDLQDVFSEGRVSTTASPSLIVLKSIDEFQEREYRRYGLVPVCATGQEFVEAVRAALPEFLNQLTDDELGITDATPQESLRFLTQWKRLSPTSKPLNTAGHDLYLGHEPTWYDATHEFISRRPAVKRIKDALVKLDASGPMGAVLIFGDAFSGKSSVLFRLSHELAQDGFRPWIFTGESALDVEATLYWLQREPKAVLIIDNASDFARDVKTVLAEARARKITAKVVLFERTRRAQHIEDMLVGEETSELRIRPQLDSGEVESLLETLQSKRRLGVLTNMAATERSAFFKGHDRKLFSAMAALEDGRGFQQRVSDELAKAISREQKELLAAVSLSSRLGYPLPFELTKTSANVTPVVAQRLVNHELVDLLEAGPGGIRTRHRIFGELLIEELPPEARRATIVRLALAVAPYISPQAIRESTLYYRIARGLMGTEILGELLGANTRLVLGVYEDLEKAYDWNARFWEQRALAAADANLFEPAFSWAEQAVGRKRDALTLTTTGKVLMLRATSEAQGGTWPTTSFERAEQSLRDARELEGNRAEYPIETFLTYIRKLINLVPQRDSTLDEQLRMLWSNWYSAILALDEGSRVRLDRIRRESATSWAKIWPDDDVAAY